MSQEDLIPDVNPRIVSVTVEAKLDGRFCYGEGTSQYEAEVDLYRVIQDGRHAMTPELRSDLVKWADQFEAGFWD
jgi:hypothetical protein